MWTQNTPAQHTLIQFNPHNQVSYYLSSCSLIFYLEGNLRSREADLSAWTNHVKPLSKMLFATIFGSQFDLFNLFFALLIGLFCILL